MLWLYSTRGTHRHFFEITYTSQWKDANLLRLFYSSVVDRKERKKIRTRQKQKTRSIKPPWHSKKAECCCSTAVKLLISVQEIPFFQLESLATVDIMTKRLASGTYCSWYTLNSIILGILTFILSSEYCLL